MPKFLTTSTEIKVGTIVLPADGSYNGERIVGIATDDNDDNYIDVVWISDQRGIFCCSEAPTDLTVASLRDRNEITDSKLDHVFVAHVLQMAPKP